MNHHEFDPMKKNTDRPSDQDRLEAAKQRGIELMQISRSRYGAGNGPAMGKDGLVPVMFVHTRDYQYVVVPEGLDLPFVDEDGSIADDIARGVYFPINEGLFVHPSQVVSLDFNKGEMMLNPALEENMREQLRGDDVIALLASYRIGRQTNLYRIAPHCIDRMLILLKGM